MSTRFKTLRQFLPVRGSSFLPNDREFAVAKRELCKHDRVYNLREYIEIIANSSTRFTVNEVKRSDILQFKEFWKGYYRVKVIANESRTSTSR